MKTHLSLILILILSVFGLRVSYADKPLANTPKIDLGFYSREGNNEKMAKTSGNNQYIRFYPEKRIIRLYIPYPYSKTVKQETINAAFNAAAKVSTGSAYIRDKFGVMDVDIVAHLDFFHWVDGQVMYDCSKPKPCKVIFGDSAMTVIKPGIVLEHKIRYKLVRD
jgi:hypothetical protein